MADVETFIASGNVIFTSPSKSLGALERKIETALQKSLGYEVKTFIRTAPELVALRGVQGIPRGADSLRRGVLRRVSRAAAGRRRDKRLYSS
mgnify:CR=1 FL=1